MLGDNRDWSIIVIKFDYRDCDSYNRVITITTWFVRMRTIIPRVKINRSRKCYNGVFKCCSAGIVASRRCHEFSMDSFWFSFFKWKNRKQVYCRLCPKVLKYSGNTTNLRFHLQSAHSTVYKALVRSENKPKEDHPKHTHQGQTTIQESLEKRQPIPSTSARLFYHLFTIVDYL